MNRTFDGMDRNPPPEWAALMSGGMLDFNDSPGPPRFYDRDELVRRLSATAGDWVPRLFPNGRRQDTEWRLADISGRPPRKQGSCVIDLSGPKAGSWYEHDARGGKGGGPLDTYGHGTGLSGHDLFRAAAAEVGMEPTGTKPASATSGTSPQPAQMPPRRDPDATEREIDDIVRHARPIRGTHAEAYLRSRALPVPGDADLLYVDDLTHFDSRAGWPGMIGIVKDSGDKRIAIHRTYLARDGQGKAPVEKSKKMLGSVKGGVVRLAPWTAGPLGYSEGIETGIAAMVMAGMPVWAGLSDGGMADAPIPQGCTEIHIFADAGKAGQDAADMLRQRAIMQGAAAFVHQPIHGDDFADDYAKGRRTLAEPAAAAAPAPEPTATAQPAGNDPDSLMDCARRLSQGTSSTEISALLTRIAEARLNPIVLRQILDQMKRQTGLSLATFEKALKTTRREVATRMSAAPEIAARYVYIKTTNSFWDRHIREFVMLDAVRNAHWHEMAPDDDGKPQNPLNALLMEQGGCDKVDGITFWPGQPEIVKEDGGLRLNIWTPPDLEPAPGSVKPFLDHVAYVLDQDRTAIQFVLNVMAHMVQKPDVKLKTAMLIIGEPGIGKSIMAEMLTRLLGPRNCTPVEESDLRSNHNEWIDGVQLVLVNELMTMDRLETMNRLKTYITDPTLRINRKNVSTYRYRNRANFMLFSNYQDAAKIEKGDRRFFVWKSKAKPKPEQYYIDLMENWFGQGGDANLLHFLQLYDISGFNPNAPAPDTTAKAEVISDSRAPADAYLQAAFDAGDEPFRSDLVVANHAIDYLQNVKRMSVSSKRMTTFLRDLGAVNLGQCRLDDGTKPAVWAIRNQERWRNSGEGHVRAEYRKPGS